MGSHGLYHLHPCLGYEQLYITYNPPHTSTLPRRQPQGNAPQAARVLGISRQMLQRKIKAYDLRATT
jgi:hypothetical protein